jgi:uncharacterized membrane protein YoaK (UPF0700 family)
LKNALPILLSLNGGYVDTAGFLALQGLFAAHVTGNFVTLAASLTLGTSGVIAKLSALPVFCVVVILARLAGMGFSRRMRAALRILLAVEVLLLTAAAALAAAFGPFEDGDAPPALGTGMVLVAAMAIQNAVNRIHLPHFPATTVMTSNTTQFLLDAADLLTGAAGDKRPEVAQRFRRLATGIGTFGAGAAIAAFCYHLVDVRCFIAAPLLAAAALALPVEQPA